MMCGFHTPDKISNEKLKSTFHPLVCHSAGSKGLAVTWGNCDWVKLGHLINIKSSYV